MSVCECASVRGCVRERKNDSVEAVLWHIIECVPFCVTVALQCMVVCYHLEDDWFDCSSMTTVASLLLTLYIHSTGQSALHNLTQILLIILIMNFYIYICIYI